jgi:hypothetical protein
MIGTVFASPPGEINEMEIHIGRLTRTTLLRSTSCGGRIHLRKREAHHGKTARGERDWQQDQQGTQS